MSEYKEVEQKTYYLPVDVLKTHPENPRLIKDKEFQILCESIKANPDLFQARPIICDKDLVIWAGNMRYRAAKESGFTEVPVQIWKGATEAQLREVMIRDNISSGQWDENILAAHFQETELESWGMDLSKFGVFDHIPENLTSDKKDTKPTIKVSFASTEDLESAKPLIEQISARYAKSTVSVSAGEI